MKTRNSVIKFCHLINQLLRHLSMIGKKWFITNKNVKYLYCVSNYPTKLEDIKMPNFKNEGIHGFSDHTIGIETCHMQYLWC